MKQASGPVKVELQQYAELKAFSHLLRIRRSDAKATRAGPEIDGTAQARAVQPLAVVDQVVSIYAGTNGYLDSISVVDVERFERELLEYLNLNQKDFRDRLAGAGALTEELKSELNSILDSFAAIFKAGN